MAKLSKPQRITITLNGQQLAVLRHLLGMGIYGRSVNDVARRLIDKGLAEFVEKPSFKYQKECE